MICFLAQFSDKPCEGRLIRAHLIPRSLLKREFPFGAYIADGMADRIPERHRRTLAPNARATLNGAVEVRPLDEIINDPATYVYACGGAMGNSGHHGAFDTARTLRVPREALPEALEVFAAAHGLEWWLDREYGPLDEKMAA